MILVHIDNITIVCPCSLKKICWFIIKLSDYFEITVFRELRHIFGLVVTCDSSKRIIYISQTVYIYKIFMCFGIRCTTPIAMSLTIKYNLSTI